MKSLENFSFKIAEKTWEIEAVHALNYKTFVEEIPQHEPNDEKKLIDKFHHENIYIICVNEQQKIVAGMIAFRDKRPFSLDQKLESLDDYLPKGHSICEIRLLAVEEQYRYSRVTQGLITHLANHAIDCGHDLAIISGTVRQTKLYSHLGFVPFGPVVGHESALYQPMYLTLEKFIELTKRSRSFGQKPFDLSGDNAVLFNFLPGPVGVNKEVASMVKRQPCSHRSEEFMRDFQKLRGKLCELVNSSNVEVLMGPGTMANDAVAAQLSLLHQPGLMLVNGEFGRRLLHCANGAGLDFQVVEAAEGSPIERDDLDKALREHPGVGWIWGTHCETSTGVLNDLDMYREFCAEHDLKLCIDCISSIGTVPVDLNGIYLASGTSGKGLASLSGLCMVFHDNDLAAAPRHIPCVLDLGIYQQKNGVPYTIQTNLVYALLAAVQSQDWMKRFSEIENWSRSIRCQLNQIGAPVLASESCAMPSVVTINLPANCSSLEIGDRLKERGILVSYHSGYLLERNWIQLCRMGAEDSPSEKVLKILEQELVR
ncbi:aminotransferase class V-fold PLP-dependent enzyme [Desulforhopalus singaporensis]|uniref:Aspartate aminotransferase n=1 Tax=Desulforhopalus singaporensis TaxID=91360 RepID=A0A1H0LU05_9BACT|nr:aminotransferase class V-fold PLP-dependent enzyme [Desulforhopalus singaporensis]SDO71583.1 aspartate aminotransferase [Desulforhopalus singaporensis]